MQPYIPLHVHSHYSLLDGLSKPNQIANRCLSIGVKSCAITDHGTIAGAAQIHKTLKDNKIKPILGCELYISSNDSSIKTKENSKLSHFIVLAKNLKGWHKLINIVSLSNKECNFYKKPRLDILKLADVVDDNLIGFCGHLGSYLADKILENNTFIDSWKKVGLYHIYQLKEIFGDNFFLESQLMDQKLNPIQVELTEKIRELAAISDTKVICTPDAHYSNQEDAVDQRILLCNNLKTTFTDINNKIKNREPVPMSTFFTSDKYYILSPEEMKSLHSEEEIDNTNYIDSLCEDYDISHKPRLPPFLTPDGSNPDEYLRQLCRDGWRDKIKNVIPKDDQDKYADRIKYELSVLQGAGLSSYFLIVSDIVRYVKNQGWLAGPGRGSAAGCLVSYLIDITSIDPIPYNLIFERFYNDGRNTATRISMPDIDIDVPINKREDVIDYIKNRYGHNNVSQMITFNTLKGRGALKDVLRVYGDVSFDEMNQITKHIPDEAKIADELEEMKDDFGEASIIRWSLENKSEELKNWCYLEDGKLNGKFAQRFEQAIRLEGTKVNQSKHAAGVVITDEPLDSVCPMIYDTKTKQPIAGMEMNDLEYLGIIKFDVLGIAMLDKVMNIRDILKNGDIT